MPYIDHAKSKEIMKLTKADLGTLVRNVTGHAHMDRHRRILGDIAIMSDSISEDFLNHINWTEREAPVYQLVQNNGIYEEVNKNEARFFGSCKLCKIKGSEETPYHLVMECPYTWKGRADLLGSYTPNRYDLLQWEPDRLVTFFKRYNLEESDPG